MRHGENDDQLCDEEHAEADNDADGVQADLGRIHGRLLDQGVEGGRAQNILPERHVRGAGAEGLEDKM